MHLLRAVLQGHLSPGEKTYGNGGGHLLGTRTWSSGVTAPSGSGVGGGSSEVEQVGSFTPGIWGGTLWWGRGLAALGSFLTPSHISFSILNMCSSTTTSSHSWSSCTAPQNMSGGLQAKWCTTGVQWLAWQFPLSAPPSNPGSSWRLWAQFTPFFSTLPGRVGQSRCHVFSFGWLAGRRLQLAGKPYSWLGHHHSDHP